MNNNCAIVWFNNDLRLHDHEPLHRAIEQFPQIIPVYVFDERKWGETEFGFAKTGEFRTNFIRESVSVLRKRLREKGSDLWVRSGLPEEIIPQLASTFGAQAVFGHKECTQEELEVEEALEDALGDSGVELSLFWGHTLYHLDDLPMSASDLPEVFTQFRKKVEKESSVREIFPTPERISSPESAESGNIPSSQDLGVGELTPDERSVHAFPGGEIAALERLNDYFWEGDHLRNYKKTRNGLIGADFSSKFSPWLAAGCISPRFIHHQVRRYEQARVSNQSTYWLIFELIWRDYFRFIGKKHGNRLFHPNGIHGRERDWSHNQKLLEAWKSGQTGIPFVDANMREIAQTGYMSNRGRQNVASYLAHNLNLDWRMGAEWFESLLLDYDVTSNWGNWNYVAGTGNDPRNRTFNVVGQAKRYDPDGDYVRLWIPELADLPKNYVHEPWKADRATLAKHGVSLGGNYPHRVAK